MNFTMSFSELMPLAPVMIVALTAIVVMLLTAIKRNHNLMATSIGDWFKPCCVLYHLLVLLAGDICTCQRDESCSWLIRSRCCISL